MEIKYFSILSWLIKQILFGIENETYCQSDYMLRVVSLSYIISLFFVGFNSFVWLCFH